MNTLIDHTLQPGVWQLGIWSLQWGVLILIQMVWFATRAPKTAAVRMLISRLVLLAGLLLPTVPQFWGLTLPGSAEALQATVPANTESTNDIDIPTSVNRPRQQNTLAHNSSPQNIRPSDSTKAPSTATAIVLKTDPQDKPLGGKRLAWLALAGIWLAGVVVGILRLVLGYRWLRHWHQTAQQVESGEIRTELELCRDELGVSRRVQLKQLSAIDSPVVVGGWRPVILVPAHWEQLSSSARRAILLHELTHVKRYDDLGRCLEELVRVCFFFHPLVYWLLAHIAADREELCDAAVVNNGIAPRELASVLLECCRKCGPGQSVLPLRTVVLPFYRQRTVKERIQNLMEEKTMSHWNLRPSRLSIVSICVLITGISAGVGGFGTDVAATDQSREPSAATDGQAPLPTMQQIQTAYRENFERMMPLAVTCRVMQADTPALIEQHRRRLKESEIFAKAKRSDITIEGKTLDEAHFEIMMNSVTEQVALFSGLLKPDVVQDRLTEKVVDQRYFWTDGRAFHTRWPSQVVNGELNLFPGAVTPAENLKTLYDTVHMASWSSGNNPPLRQWTGGENSESRIADTMFSLRKSLAPLGTVREDWIRKSNWHELDQFMSGDPADFTVAGREDLNGRQTILVEKVSPDSDQPNLYNRVRGWLDLNRGYLPLHLEWSHVYATDQAKPNFEHATLDRDLDVLQVQQTAGGFYPTRIKGQQYIHDEQFLAQQNAEIAAGRKPKPVSLPRVPSRYTILEVTAIVPRQTIEPAVLALEFPKGTRYVNGVDNRKYVAGDASPLPLPPQPIPSGQVAPEFDVAEWSDGQSRTLADFRGKVVALFITDPIPNKEEAAENASAIAVMKKIRDKYTSQDLVFVEIYGHGADVNAVRQWQSARGWDCIAGVDNAADPSLRTSAGATAHKYGCNSGMVVIGRDGRVASNMDAMSDEESIALYQRAAKELSIRWSFSEFSEAEPTVEDQMRIFEFLLTEQFDGALGLPTDE